MQPRSGDAFSVSRKRALFHSSRYSCTRNDEFPVKAGSGPSPLPVILEPEIRPILFMKTITISDATGLRPDPLRAPSIRPRHVHASLGCASLGCASANPCNAFPGFPGAPRLRGRNVTEAHAHGSFSSVASSAACLPATAPLVGLSARPKVCPRLPLPARDQLPTSPRTALLPPRLGCRRTAPKPT
jgi:hypothetical protein